MTNSVLLFSGGLDSFIAWRLLGEPDCVYVRLGHRYERQEIHCIEHLRQRFGVKVNYADRLHLGDLEQPDAYIPQRNLLLAIVAHLSAPHVDTVVMGALKGESSRDKSGRFFRDTTRLLTYLAGRSVKVVAPFRSFTKADLVRAYTSQYGAEDLGYTHSCYDAHSPSTQGCGRCMACYRRWVAMTANGINEPYDSNPGEWQTGVSVRTGVSYMRKADWREWGGILSNNLVAMRQRWRT